MGGRRDQRVGDAAEVEVDAEITEQQPVPSVRREEADRERLGADDDAVEPAALLRGEGCHRAAEAEEVVAEAWKRAESGRCPVAVLFDLDFWRSL